MNSHLLTMDGTRHPTDPGSVQHLLDEGAAFWMDVSEPDADAVRDLLGQVFGFHPLAVEDAQHFGQRPKVDPYEGFTLLVVYGALADGELVEVHCFATERFLVTVHHRPCPDLQAVAERLEQRAGMPNRPVMVLHRVMDVLVDSYFPLLAHFDDRIDVLEDEILRRPTDRQLGELFDMKRSLIAVRKVVAPQRDMAALLLSGRGMLPGMTDDAERYFRDLYDHLIRIGDLVDSYRDLMSGVLDTHLSTVSNRLNVVMKQLAVIATVFLPMSFLTGFFGQNFSWMVNRIGGSAVFFGAGIGCQVVVIAVLLVFFQRRGWLPAEGAVPGPAAEASATGAGPPRWRHIAPARRLPPVAGSEPA